MSNISIQRRAYALEQTGEASAEITLYGDIYEERPRDWEGNLVEGNFVLLGDFLEDLDRVASCKQLNIRINSYGGDAGVSITIHNRLRELVKEGKTVTCTVDGVAMSGGSVIMCACETVRVHPASLIMIHKCNSFLFGAYNADELRSHAQSMDAWDKGMAAIYRRKTGLSETVLTHMMSDTTYMTGREAVEKKFADELLDDAQPLPIAASADGRSLYVRGRQIPLAPGFFAPDSIPTVTTGADTPDEAYQKPPVVTGSKGGIQMTEKELREQFPEIVAQVETKAKASVDVAAAVKAERERIREIDQVACLYPDDLVRSAKYGDTPCTARDLAYQAAVAAARKGKKLVDDMEEDAKASGTGDVSASAPPADEEENGIDLNHARQAAQAYNAHKKEVR